MLQTRQSLWLLLWQGDVYIGCGSDKKDEELWLLLYQEGDVDVGRSLNRTDEQLSLLLHQEEGDADVGCGSIQRNK